jgi:outer membrane protein OmpA-like peptidoglycan-associated protein
VALSLSRADAVVAYLVSKGFPQAQLAAKGMGPDAPIASNATAEGKAENRRIDFVVRKEG